VHDPAEGTRSCARHRFDYRLVEPAHIEPSALADGQRTEIAIWLYNELDIEPGLSFDPARGTLAKAASKRPARGKKGSVPVFRHDILLSNGSEIRLRFHRLSFHRHPAVEVTQRKATIVPRSA
jgi:hypothetical protein